MGHARAGSNPADCEIFFSVEIVYVCRIREVYQKEVIKKIIYLPKICMNMYCSLTLNGPGFSGASTDRGGEESRHQGFLAITASFFIQINQTWCQMIDWIFIYL